MTLAGKRVAILAEEDFEDSELTEPMKALEGAGAQLVVVGSGSKSIYRGKRRKASVSVDTTADKVNADDFDAIIVPGGYAPDKMRLHQAMIDLVSKIHHQGKVVAAVCHGPQLLISADIVGGRRVTSCQVSLPLPSQGLVTCPQ